VTFVLLALVASEALVLAKRPGPKGPASKCLKALKPSKEIVQSVKEECKNEDNRKVCFRKAIASELDLITLDETALEKTAVEKYLEDQLADQADTLARAQDLLEDCFTPEVENEFKLRKLMRCLCKPPAPEEA